MKLVFRHLLLVGLLGASLNGCATPGLVSGLDGRNFDPGVRPQDDLYRAINGQWLKTHPVPADKSNFGAFTQLDDDAQKQLREIVESVAAHGGSGETRKVGDYYRAFMDEPRLETLGLTPVAPLLAQIDAAQGKAEIVALMASFSRIGIDMPLNPGVHQDNRKSTDYIGDLYQGGLGLPDRDYYLQNDAKFKAIRQQYVAHIARMFNLAGLANAETSARVILLLETHLAQAQWDKVTLRDPVKGYNKRDLAGLRKLSNDLRWPEYLKAVGFDSLPAVIVSQPTYLSKLGRELRNTSLKAWKLYLKWQVLSHHAPLLSKRFVDESFAFHGKVLNGIPENQPRWKRGVDAVESALGEAIGKIYVAEHFPPENKARMLALVQNLLKAYALEFDTLDWMSPQTRAAAKEKLAKFNVKIGYPDVWRDYSALQVRADDLVGNTQRADAFEYDRDIAKLGKPIDRNEWGMTPQTVNAYYNPEMNEIVFPAAILQPPFFNAAADDAVNYGGIGAVIGHEISHGFDDEGSQYDGDGNLRDWWTAGDRRKFEARAQKLAAQYGAYEPVAGYKLNGKFTLGENIADLGGLTIALKAYQLSLEGKPAPVLDGQSGARRLFMGWAQVWRRNYREENLINRIKTDPHSPSEFRANGVVRNVPDFYQAFELSPGDRLFLPEAQRVKIW